MQYICMSAIHKLIPLYLSFNAFSMLFQNHFKSKHFIFYNYNNNCLREYVEKPFHRKQGVQISHIYSIGVIYQTNVGIFEKM